MNRGGQARHTGCSNARTMSAGLPMQVRAQGANPLHMLLVDDEPAVRYAFKRFFERRGWKVDVASDSASAATAASSAYYDVLVTDYDLVREKAHDVIRAVAGVDPTLCTKVVIFTAHVFDVETVMAEANAGRLIVEKTEPIDHLERAMRHCARPR